MNATDFQNDIPADLAYSAYNGVSMFPERRAQSTRSEYAAGLAATFEELSNHAKTDEARAMMAEEFARFREGYRARWRAYLASSARCVSWFIAGPSNFPAARMNKRADIAHRRLSEVLDFEKWAKAAIIRKLHPEWRPIMAGDDNASERLTVKILRAESLQERMKDCNAAIRKHAKAGREAQIGALLALGVDASTAAQLLEPDFCGRIGFPDYALTNNSANIRRMKGRIHQIDQAKAQPEAEAEGANARVEDSPADNRVRLFFPGKPDEAVRTELKRSGFRWSPTIGAWQAYRHDHTVAIARRIAGVAETVAV